MAELTKKLRQGRRIPGIQRRITHYAEQVKTIEAEAEQIECQPGSESFFRREEDLVITEYAQICARVYVIRGKGEIIGEVTMWDINVDTPREQVRKELLSYLDSAMDMVM